MELRKIEYKNAEDKNCIIVVESKDGSELTVKKDGWNKEINKRLFSNGLHRSLCQTISDILGIDFIFFSFAKKAPSKNSPFLFIISFAFDSNLMGYESRTTVKDIEVPIRANIETAIEGYKKRLGEIDVAQEQKQEIELRNAIKRQELFIDLIDAVKALEEAISDNWQEIAEANYSPQTTLNL